MYAPITDTLQPNPYLNVPDRDVVTTTGKKLTLVNPAYMTRMVHEIQKEIEGVQGHITSLDPIRPVNAPGEWEIRALKEFEKGKREVSSVKQMHGKPYMRLMRPLRTEKPCLACHAEQGYKEGDVRGGISVSVPIKPLWSAATSNVVASIAGHGGVWLFGILGILGGARWLDRSITEREQLRERLVQAKKMEAIGTLSAGIAHDCNNLLTILNGYTELILSDKTEQDPDFADLTKMHVTCRKGTDMVQKLVTFSKRSEISLEPTDLNAIVRDSVTLMQRTFPKTIEIETRLDKDLKPIDADASQFEQVLMNLCIKAKEAMQEGGKLKIQTRNVTVNEDYCRLHAG